MQRRVREEGGGLRLNPLWLLDLAALGAAAAFAWIAAGPRPLPELLAFPLAGELALGIVAVAVVARTLDLRARRRAAEAAARSELARRLETLDEALMDLRRSLSREAARRFLERKDAFASGLEAFRARLEAPTERLARQGLDLCEGLTAGLALTIPRRAAITSAAYRLSQEIARAGRRGELDPYAAGDLTALIEDALGVMDEALYAEWNADHFGRLGAVQRHFSRRVERRDGEVVRRIDGEAATLFDALVGHVRDKVALVEVLANWERVRFALAFALSGVRAPPRPAPERPSVAARFAVSPIAGARTVEALPRRLPAAND